MAIVQISKITQRSGNLVDLPQLDEAEFGWASDERRLFIGKTTPNENIEVLTSYSNVVFSQIVGSGGSNLNIDGPTNGQVLTYVSSTNTWENYSGNNSQLNGEKLQLGNVANISMEGGAIGYVLETDGIGNLSWTPKGTLYTPIIALSNATPIIMTVANTTPYTNNAAVTISGVLGTNANSIVNGQTFYIQISVDFATSGNVGLYTSTGTGSPVNGTGLVATANTGIATSLTSGAGGTTAIAAGVTTSVQYNSSGTLAGDAEFTYNTGTKSIVLTGNINANSVTASSAVTANVLVSTITTGTSPITVTSTTRVSNLSVAYANVSDYSVVTTQTTGTFYPTLVSSNSTSNLALASNANLSFNVATGTLSATRLTGALTTAAQPNITSVGILTSVSVSGNANIGNIGTGIITATGNANVGNLGTTGVYTATLSATGNANIGNIGTGIITATGNANVGNLGTTGVYTATLSATGNANIGNVGTVIITATGNVTGANFITSGILSVTGNANVGNLGTSGRVIASILESNVSTGTSPLTIASTTRVTNLNVSYSNVSDYVAMTALTTGTVYPSFVSGTAAANYSLGSNTAIYANIANGAFVSKEFVGNITSNLITTGGVGTSGSLTGNWALSSTSNLTLGTGILDATAGTFKSVTLTAGANSTAGTITGNWSLSVGSKLQSTYADLAEYYNSDIRYEPGTVVQFGGDKEVTIATDETNKVAGVVSRDPAYGMNAACKGIAIAIALQGRVPVKVYGNISKGDMLVSAGNGFAKSMAEPKMGTVIGKSLEDFSGASGIIEVAVGRL